MGPGQIEHDRTWNGERLFLHILWNLPEGDQLAEVRIQFLPYKNQVWIGSLSVHPSFRGTGLGKRIVDAVEEDSRNENVELIRLFSRRDAAGFWKKMGYRPEEDTRYLRKSLRPNPGG